MKRSLKFPALMLCLCVLAALLSSCAAPEPEPEAAQELNIYASFYPLYALTEPLLKDVPDTKLHCLVQPQDGCLRNYWLSDWDLTLLMRSADMVVIGGSGLESFESTLYSLGESGPAVAAVLYNKELEDGIMPGGSDEANHWQDENPHLYMDPEGAIQITESIAAQLSVADPGNSELYMRNLDDAETRLRSVLEKNDRILKSFAGEKVILMSENAVYIARAHGLEIEFYAARESGEACFDAELEKLIGQLLECTSRVILIEEQAPERFCEALEAAGFHLVRLDTLSTRRAEEGFAGYLRALEENARRLEAAFESTAA